MTGKYRTGIAACVNCGQELDAAAPVNGGRAPEPGDFSICCYCHHLQVFSDNMKFRNPTDREMTKIAGNPEMVTAMKMLHWADRFRSTEPKG
jgi:hypothetical protein